MAISRDGKHLLLNTELLLGWSRSGKLFPVCYGDRSQNYSSQTCLVSANNNDNFSPSTCFPHGQPVKVIWKIEKKKTWYHCRIWYFYTWGKYKWACEKVQNSVASKIWPSPSCDKSWGTRCVERMSIVPFSWLMRQKCRGYLIILVILAWRRVPRCVIIRTR